MNKLRIWLAYYIMPKDTRKYLIEALSNCTKELEREVEKIKSDIEFSYKPINPFQNDGLSKKGQSND